MTTMIKCRFENGNVAFLRHVTVGALVLRAGRLLLIKRAKNSSAEPGKWAMPGGYLDRDESAAEAGRGDVPCRWHVAGCAAEEADRAARSVAQHQLPEEAQDRQGQRCISI